MALLASTSRVAPARAAARVSLARPAPLAARSRALRPSIVAATQVGRARGTTRACAAARVPPQPPACDRRLCPRPSTTQSVPASSRQIAPANDLPGARRRAPERLNTLTSSPPWIPPRRAGRRPGQDHPAGPPPRGAARAGALRPWHAAPAVGSLAAHEIMRAPLPGSLEGKSGAGPASPHPLRRPRPRAPQSPPIASTGIGQR